LAKNGLEPPFDVWLAQEYKHFSQLYIKNSKVVIGDDVFVKEAIDQATGLPYFRAIYHDSKLNPGTSWTSNQKTELIEWFKNNPTKNFITFEVRSNLDPTKGYIIKQTDKVRIYKTDVWKSISNGKGARLITEVVKL
jgi:ribosome-interacting GTPase 1